MRESYLMVLENLIASLIFIFGFFLIKYVLKKELRFFPLLVTISILPIISIFRPGTYESGDLTLHTDFLYNFFENLKQGILIPQWASHLCGGYGCPIFIFEYITPYYIASVFHLIGFSLLNSMKLFLASSFILSGITMYYFVKDDFGAKAAFMASLLYLFAPIRFIEMHFRVSVGTDAVFIFIPLAFLFAKKALKGQPAFIILNALNTLFLLLSHSSTAFIVIPLAFIYALLKKKNIKEMKYVFISFILGFGVSAWYIFPALFEIKYTWYWKTIADSVFSFPPIIDAIYSRTILGFLYQGHNGETRPVIGYSAVLIVSANIYFFLKKRNRGKDFALNIFFLCSFFACFFLMLSFSKALWENIFFFRSFIIYWRVLVPIAFISAYLGAMTVKHLNKNLLVIFCLFIIFSTKLNWGNRNTVPFDPNSFFTQVSLYTEYFLPDNPVYLERYNSRIGNIEFLAKQKPDAHLEILSGKGSIKETYRNPIDHRYIVDADTDLLLSENTYYFPGWVIYANGIKVPVMLENPMRFGANVFILKKGSYEVQVKFEDTQIRKLGKIISLSSLVCLLGLFIIFNKFPLSNSNKASAKSGESGIRHT